MGEETNTNVNANNENETLEEKIVKMQQQLLQMNDIITENDRLKSMNEKLFEKNQEYFLKITGQNSTHDDDNQKDEYKDFVGEEFYNKLSSKEQKLLHTILEGEDE